MNISHIYSKLHNTICNYYANIYKTNNYIVEKYFDLESQKNIDIIIEPNVKLSTYSCEYIDDNKSDNKSGNLPNCFMPEFIILGHGFDRINGLEWKRTSINNDYMVSYKGLHLIPFEQIKKIYSRIEHHRYIDFEKILKLYIDCGKNLDLTIVYLKF